MMKNRKSNSLVILFDILFIYLFASLLEAPPGLKIQYLGGGLVDGIGLYSLDDDGLPQFRTKLGSSKDPSDVLQGYWSVFPCIDNTLCRSVPGSSLLVYGDLMTNMATVTLQSCLLSPEKCSSLSFVISKDGSLDLEATAALSPVILDIEGLVD